jgi:threonine synthase
VGTAVASLAAKAGVDAYVFYPNALEETKARALHGARREGLPGGGQLRRSQPPLPRSRGSDGDGLREHHAAPVLRGGREDGGVRDRRAAGLERAGPHHQAAAGGTLSSRLHKGLGELQLLGLSETDGTRIHIAQPSGCNPIATAILAEEAEVHPVTPETAAHSLAIGAPGDGYLVIDAVRKRGGTGGFASDPEIFAGIDLLAATEGLLTEPAGGTTIAVLEKLAAIGRFAPDDTVVAIITGNGLKTLDDHPAEAVAGEGRLRAGRDAGGA